MVPSACAIQLQTPLPAASASPVHTSPRSGTDDDGDAASGYDDDEEQPSLQAAISEAAESLHTVCAAIDDIDRAQHHELEAIDRLIRVQAGHEVGTRGGAVSVGVAEQIHHVKQRCEQALGDKLLLMQEKRELQDLLLALQERRVERRRDL